MNTWPFLFLKKWYPRCDFADGKPYCQGEEQRKWPEVEDAKIVELFWARNEDAIKETDAVYGRRLNALARNILQSREDAEESVNDTYMETAGCNTISS